jgi:hypothetical protein
MKEITMLANSTPVSTNLAHQGRFHIRMRSNMDTKWHWKSAARYQDCGMHCKYFEVISKVNNSVPTVWKAIELVLPEG